VTLTGPESRSGETNENGCAVFQFLTPGTYTLHMNSGGYVDKSGTQAVDVDQVVVPATVNQAPPQVYDRGATFNVSFNTPRTDGKTEPAHTNAISLTNSGVPNGGVRTSTSTTVNGVFPFVGAYLVYSGTCASNDPSKWDSDYFVDNPTFGRQIAAVGGTHAVTVREPAIAMKVVPPTGYTFNTVPAVKVTQTDVGCTAVFTTTAVSATDGAFVRSNYPFGTYSVCASATLRKTSDGSTTARRMTVANIANTQFGGVSVGNTTIPSTGTTGGAAAGACP
jgi:hypothetical protein